MPSSSAIRFSELEFESNTKTSSLLSHKPQTKVRVAKFCATPVAVLSFRAGQSQGLLCAAASDVLETRVSPYLHPNIVQVLGVAQGSTSAAHPSHFVTEYLPVSLYDVLHRDRLTLSRREIALIATDVLRALLYLHTKGESFGSTLTSRKVMLGGNGGAKLRRFNAEIVQRAASAQAERGSNISETYSFWKTQYEPEVMRASADHVCDDDLAARVDLLANSHNGIDGKEHDDARNLPEQVSTAQKHDLYAFGVLLLEMVTSEKPNPETCNRISRADQMDPVFGQVVRIALSCGGHPDLVETKRNEPQINVVREPSAAHIFQLLAENELQRQQHGDERPPSLSFPCFLHADRFAVATELLQIEETLATRESQFAMAVKRLGAVEQELLEEQSNFEVLVRQFEKAELEKQQAASEACAMELKFQRMQLANDGASADIQRLTELVRSQHHESEGLRMIIEDYHRCVLRQQDSNLASMTEKQGLLMEILKLTNEKRRLNDEKAECERNVSRLAAQVGGEKDAMEDIEGRWRQATFKAEREQMARKKLERHNEQLCTQLLKMEEERSIYSFELSQCPTGSFDPKRTAAYVLELKEKEIRMLQESAVQREQTEVELRQAIHDYQRVNERFQESYNRLREMANDVEAQNLALTANLESKEAEIIRLTEQHKLSSTQICKLSKKVADLEEELELQAKKRSAEESARRSRQCLTPQCDAPKYLVGESGYCKECEEKARKQLERAPLTRQKPDTASSHRRQRSLDSSSSFSLALCVNNAKNVQIVEFVRAIEEKQSRVRGDCDSEDDVQDAISQILGHVKQLTAALKNDEALKDDLPECRVFKTLLATMKLLNESLPVQLECCRCLTVAAFSHNRNRIILVADGAVEAVLAARKRFCLDTKLLEATSVLLTNLSHNCESNRKRISDTGGIDSILQVMQAFPHHFGIQKKSCWALLTLAGSDAMCQEIASQGGVGAVIAGMLNCPSDEDVQYYGTWALLNLVSGTSRLQQFARREGVAEVMQAALACFPDHAGIREKAEQVLQLVDTSR